MRSLVLLAGLVCSLVGSQQNVWAQRPFYGYGGNPYGGNPYGGALFGSNPYGGGPNGGSCQAAPGVNNYYYNTAPAYNSAPSGWTGGYPPVQPGYFPGNNWGYQNMGYPNANFNPNYQGYQGGRGGHHYHSAHGHSHHDQGRQQYQSHPWHLGHFLFGT